MVRAIMLGFLLCASLFDFPSGGRGILEAQEGPERPDTLTVTVVEARRLTLAQNPTFLGALERVMAARGDLRGARAYPLNPEIEIEGPGSLTGGSGLDAYEVRFGQEIEWAGQRGLRISAAEAGLSAEESRVLDEARRVLAEVESTYVAFRAAEQRLALAEQIQAFNEQLLGAVRTELVEGEVSLLQANLAEIEAARGRARVLAAEQEAASAGLELGRLLGLSTEVILRTSGTSLPRTELFPTGTDRNQHVLAALEARPDLSASIWDFEQTGSLRSLASRESFPNLKVGTIADRGAGEKDTGFGLFIGISLPVFQRNQGLRSRRDAEEREASMRVLALELQVRKEVVDALQNFDKASQEMLVLEEDVLEPARQNQGLLDTAYSEGKLDLPSLLLLRNQLLDAELEYWGAWERRQKASIELRKATAAILDGALTEIEEKIR